MSLCLSVFLTLFHGHAVLVYGPCLPVNKAAYCVVRDARPVVWIEPEVAERIG